MQYLDTMKRKLILEKPSAVISISDKLTTVQRKFYNALLYNAKEQLKKTPDKIKFEINFSELKRFFNISSKNISEYKKSIIKLMTTIVEYNLLEKDKDIWEAFVLLPYVYIQLSSSHQNIIRYEIPTKIRESLLKKDKYFAKIDLLVIKALNSKYSIILYELLKDYENTEIPLISLEKFRKIFGITDKYKIIRDIRKRVLDPAIKEINNNENINWFIEYKLIKEGKKYTHIKFIKKKKTIMKQLEQQKEKKVESAKVQVLISLIPEKYRSKVLERYIAEIKDKYDVDYIEAQILYANSKNPENYLAYLKTAIKEDYANYEEYKEQDKQAKKEFQDFFAKAQKIYKEKVLPKRDDIKFEDYLRDYIYYHFKEGKITEKQKDLYLEFWEKLYGNNA